MSSNESTCQETSAAKRSNEDKVIKLHPLGVMPRRVWDEKRLEALTQAIERYSDANIPIPEVWKIEFNELMLRLWS